MPRTRTLSVCVHEFVYPLIRDLADESSNGSMSTLIMVLIYAELVKRGKITVDQAEKLIVT